jgi:hypothetical protein
MISRRAAAFLAAVFSWVWFVTNELLQLLQNTKYYLAEAEINFSRIFLIYLKC